MDRIKHSTVLESHFLTVIHGNKDTKEYSQLGLTYGTGQGNEYKKTDTVTVDIWTDGKPLFTGSFEELKARLAPVPTAAKYKIGMPIVWSYGKENQYTIINAYSQGNDIFYVLADKAGNISAHINEGELLPY